ncbi:unnamed protein product [Polarella glacialis]|uniref:Kinesin motor domain-containing protein n=1 Tax=Polarella glacialis TaxID=89957 RepID=A0A813EWQ8_POLGL|nr:unnamed protein product [Polarella glacialis]
MAAREAAEMKLSETDLVYLFGRHKVNTKLQALFFHSGLRSLDTFAHFAKGVSDLQSEMEDSFSLDHELKGLRGTAAWPPQLCEWAAEEIISFHIGEAGAGISQKGGFVLGTGQCNRAGISQKGGFVLGTGQCNRQKHNDGSTGSPSGGFDLGIHSCNRHRHTEGSAGFFIRGAQIQSGLRVAEAGQLSGEEVIPPRRGRTRFARKLGPGPEEASKDVDLQSGGPAIPAEAPVRRADFVEAGLRRGSHGGEKMALNYSSVDKRKDYVYKLFDEEVFEGLTIKMSRDDLIYFNKVGTFGVGSDSYWWGGSSGHPRGQPTNFLDRRILQRFWSSRSTSRSPAAWGEVDGDGAVGLCYTASALFWERPFLVPIYAWVSSPQHPGLLQRGARLMAMGPVGLCYTASALFWDRPFLVPIYGEALPGADLRLGQLASASRLRNSEEALRTGRKVAVPWAIKFLLSWIAALELLGDLAAIRVFGDSWPKVSEQLRSRGMEMSVRASKGLRQYHDCKVSWEETVESVVAPEGPRASTVSAEVFTVCEIEVQGFQAGLRLTVSRLGKRFRRSAKAFRFRVGVGKSRHRPALTWDAKVFTVCEIEVQGFQAGLRLTVSRLGGFEKSAARFQEAVNVNQSLFVLRKVQIRIAPELLADCACPGSGEHVPYRESKLTSLLQHALGGNSYLLMLACLSPSDRHYEENLSTLQYASQAASIKNEPSVNVDPKDRLIQQLEARLTTAHSYLLQLVGASELPADLLEAEEAAAAAAAGARGSKGGSSLGRSSGVSGARGLRSARGGRPSGAQQRGPGTAGSAQGQAATTGGFSSGGPYSGGTPAKRSAPGAKDFDELASPPSSVPAGARLTLSAQSPRRPEADLSMTARSEGRNLFAAADAIMSEYYEAPATRRGKSASFAAGAALQASPRGQCTGAQSSRGRAPRPPSLPPASDALTPRVGLPPVAGPSGGFSGSPKRPPLGSMPSPLHKLGDDRGRGSPADFESARSTSAETPTASQDGVRSTGSLATGAAAESGLWDAVEELKEAKAELQKKLRDAESRAEELQAKNLALKKQQAYLEERGDIAAKC